MSASKWIPDLNAETPTLDAGRRALSLRLECLREALGTVLQSVDDDLENVHQLRVACRRASAAVELFQVCMPNRIARQAKKTLRTYRRAAGDARDWDVVLLALQKRLKDASGDQLPGVDLLFGYCLAQRIPAQDRLEVMCPEYPFEYERWMTGILAGLRQFDEAPTCVGDLGRNSVLPQFDAFWDHVRRPGMTWPELHECRIEAKRLRYVLELLAAAFPEKPLDAIYRRISDIQSILGDANDGFIGIERMEVLRRRLPQLVRHLWPRWSPLIDELVQEYRMQMHTARDRFEVWKQKVERERLDNAVQNLFGGLARIPENLLLTEQAS